MDHTKVNPKTLRKVGLFTLGGIALIGAVSFYVNDRPYWWRSCQFVRINVEDATGLKEKSAIRSLGLEIGYLKEVDLSETYVTLGICITAPVEVLPATRAYIRAEGFLGDKFVELKPVRYLEGRYKAAAKPGVKPKVVPTVSPEPVNPTEPNSKSSAKNHRSEGGFRASLLMASRAMAARVLDWLVPSAHAEAEQTPSSGREIPVGEGSQDIQKLVGRMDNLMKEVTSLTTNLKDAINPEELRGTLKQLNKALENASKTLSPESGLNQTARRTLTKLEDTAEQLRDQMTRINQGEGSLGKLLNDPVYAEEVRKALVNLNQLLNKVGEVRFVVDVGTQNISAYSGGRGWFLLSIWPKKDRYYRLGVSVDPRGRLTQSTTTTTAGGAQTVVQTQTEETTGIQINASLGKVFFNRLDLSGGVIYGDGAISATIYAGPQGYERAIQIRADAYTRVAGSKVDGRFMATLFPLWSADLFSALYVQGGLEATHPVNNKTLYIFGAGLSFDDEAIKLLFSFI